jgi:radial spoke head protein 4A
LSTDSTATNVRFFGKIYGTETDYYIAEGMYEGG